MLGLLCGSLTVMMLTQLPSQVHPGQSTHLHPQQQTTLLLPVHHLLLLCHLQMWTQQAPQVMVPCVYVCRGLLHLSLHKVGSNSSSTETCSLNTVPCFKTHAHTPLSLTYQNMCTCQGHSFVQVSHAQGCSKQTPVPVAAVVRFSSAYSILLSLFRCQVPMHVPRATHCLLSCESSHWYLCIHGL